MKTVSAYSETYKAQQTLFVATWDTAATHTVTVEVVGTADHPKFTVDAVVIRGPKKPRKPAPPAPTPDPTPTPEATPTPTPGLDSGTDT